ncbi:MAG: hypothetical protein PHN82_01505 [bacterium]|nr:hypothetical protein [bacterium]
MKVAVIGPSDIDTVARAAGVGAGLIREAAAETGRLLAAAGHELVVCPDRGVAVIAAAAYKEAGGRRLRGLIPTAGDAAAGSPGRVQRNRPLCDEVLEDLTWYEQHSRLVRLADAMICIGMSCGTVCEIAWTKWTKRIPVLVIRGLCSPVPAEIGAETDIRYADSPAAAVAALEGSG